MSGFGQFGTFWLASWFVWKIPSRRATKLAEFSHTEEGSSLDMMAAAEAESVRPNLRRKFFLHALDEHKHARWFADRATTLSAGTGNPASRILDDVQGRKLDPLSAVSEIMSKVFGIDGSGDAGSR